MAVAHSIGEAGCYAGASGASEAILMREVALFASFRVRAESNMGSAVARDILKRGGCRAHPPLVREGAVGAADRHAWYIGDQRGQ